MGAKFGKVPSFDAQTASLLEMIHANDASVTSVKINLDGEETQQWSEAEKNAALRAWSGALAVNSRVTSVDISCANTAGVDEALAQLVRTLSSAKVCTSIDMSGTNMRDCLKLSHALGSAPLHFLNLSKTFVGQAAVDSLCRSLPINKALNNLTLSGNRLSPVCVRLLSEALNCGTCSIRALALDHNHIGDEGVVELFGSPGSGHASHQLVRLDVTYCRIFGEKLGQFFKAMKSQEQVAQELAREAELVAQETEKARAARAAHAFENKLENDEDAELDSTQLMSVKHEALSRFLLLESQAAVAVPSTVERPPLHLTKLILDHNPVQLEGALSLARGLHNNPSLSRLRVLCLKGSQIGTAAHLFIAANTGITKLDLSGAAITDRGGQRLLMALCQNTTLTDLNVANNGLGRKFGDLMRHTLHTNKTLRRLDVSENNVAPVSEALSLSHSLTSINLSDTPMTLVEGEKLLQIQHMRPRLVCVEAARSSLFAQTKGSCKQMLDTLDRGLNQVLDTANTTRGAAATALPANKRQTTDQEGKQEEVDLWRPTAERFLQMSVKNTAVMHRHNEYVFALKSFLMVDLKPHFPEDVYNLVSGYVDFFSWGTKLPIAQPYQPVYSL
mmetsp:Transcript_26947/g.53055  ORF Transcript_26947/g.53055 Transcript_26947/m.53055 type:complete len:617 (+) Transcript_26947:56-1906(+)